MHRFCRLKTKTVLATYLRLAIIKTTFAFTIIIFSLGKIVYTHRTSSYSNVGLETLSFSNYLSHRHPIRTYYMT